MRIRCGLNWLRRDAAEASVSIIRMVSELCLWYIFASTLKTLTTNYLVISISRVMVFIVISKCCYLCWEMNLSLPCVMQALTNTTGISRTFNDEKTNFSFRGDCECPKIVSLFVRECVNSLSKCDCIIGPLSYVTTAEITFCCLVGCDATQSDRQVSIFQPLCCLELQS
jgi:hypothetical protein